MNNIQKIERALAFAKEVNLNDEQTKELIAMVLGLINLRLNLNPPTTTPSIPWTTQPGWPTYPGDTIISYHVAPTSTGSLEDFVAGRCTNVDLPVGEVITGTFQVDTGCACTTKGQPHSDNCKAADSIFQTHKVHDH